MGNLHRKKLLWIGRFSWGILLGIARWCCQIMWRPKILWRRLLLIATKPWNLRKFAPSKVSRYTVYGFCLVLQILEAGSHQVSYVMVRGSVPVFWTQPGYKYRPPPIIEKGDTHMSAIYVPRLSHTSVVKYTLLVVSTQERRRLRRLLGSTLKNSLVSINSR